MTQIDIRAVSTRKERKQFLNLPWALYRHDPNWIPPLRTDQEELVGYKHHPFYHENQAQTFLAYRDGEVVGRVAAILNRGHNELYKERRGFFGFFESIDDQAVADGLFAAVKKWFADRDIHKLRGPMNPSMNYTVGTLVEGFDSPPTFMMTYNPPYHERLILGAGFKTAQDLYAFWGQREMLPKIEAKLGPITYQILEHMDVKLRTLDKKRFAQEVAGFLDIYNKSMVNTWGFVPMTEAEMQHMAKSLQWLIVPELAVRAEIDGRLVGVVFGLLDYNPRIKLIDGRLFPFGFIRLLRNKSAIKKIRLISTNVLPEYQRMGVGLALLHGLMPKSMEWGIQEAEFSWVLESNSLSRRSLEKGGAKRTKTYRVYDFDAEKSR